MAEVFDTKLTPEETLDLTNRLMGFYEGLDTIQDYFLERKKEKVVGVDHDKYTKLMFDDYGVEPKDMDKVKFSFDSKKEKIIEFQEKNIAILPYLKESTKLELSKNCIEALFDPNKSLSENYYQAKWFLIVGILAANTNIDYDAENFDNIVNCGLWDLVKSNIENYDEFISDLKNIVNLEHQNRSVGNTIDKLTIKIMEFFDYIETLDLSEEGIKKLVTTLEDKTSELGIIPNSGAEKKPVRSQKIKKE